jgi:hypothetical protein
MDNLLAEFFEKCGSNTQHVVRLYGMKTKKDERSGHYFGVATKISRGGPRTGSRVNSERAEMSNSRAESVASYPNHARGFQIIESS